MRRGTPTEREYTRIHTICREASELRHDPELMHQRLVQGLIELIGADRGGSMFVDVSGTSPGVVHWGGCAGWRAKDLEQFEGFVAGASLLDDGGFQLVHKTLAQGPRVSGARFTAWSDRDWDAGADGRSDRGLGFLDDVMFAAFRASWHGVAMICGVFLHRLRDGARRRFDQRDVALLRVFNEWRLSDYLAGSFGEFSWRRPAQIRLSPSQRYCFHAWLDGATQQEIASGLESRGLESGFVDRSRVWRRLNEVAEAFGVGCPNDLRSLARPLRPQDTTTSKR